MAKDPAFLFYPGDYLRDTQCLSEHVQVAYDRIICEHMRNICIRQDQLNFFTKRFTEEQKNELMMVLEKKDDGFCIPWVAESICKRRDYSQSRRENRAGKHKDHMIDISETYDSHMENAIVNEDKDVININVPFEDFWNAYEKKVGDQTKIEKKWNALKDGDRLLIMAHLPKYKLSEPQKKFRKNPETYLNNKSWLDEIISNNGTNQRIITGSSKTAGTNEVLERLAEKLAARGKTDFNC